MDWNGEDMTEMYKVVLDAEKMDQNNILRSQDQRN